MATPTAASSSTATGGFCDGDFICALLARSAHETEPGGTILYDPVPARRCRMLWPPPADGPTFPGLVAFFKTACARRMPSSAAKSPGTRDFCADSGSIPALRLLELLLDFDGRSLSS